MAIKQSKAIYVTDRGEEYYVEDMQNSHLANTIAHIDKKIHALNLLADRSLDSELNEAERQALRDHVECLIRDQLTLARELARRESCKDDC